MRSSLVKSIKIESGEHLFYSEWGMDKKETIIFITAKNSDAALLNKTYLSFPNHHVVYIEPQHPLPFNSSLTVFDFTNQAFILRGLMKGLDIKKANIIAESVYGITAGMLSHFYPEIISSLVLISPTSKITSNLAKGMSKVMSYDDVKAVNDNHIQNLLWDPSFTPPNLFNLIEEEFSLINIDKGKSSSHSDELSDWTLDAQRILSPTLLLWGGSDDMVAHEDRKILIRAITGSIYKEIPLCDRWLLHEAPAKVFREIDKFFDKKKP